MNPSCIILFATALLSASALRCYQCGCSNATDCSNNNNTNNTMSASCHNVVNQMNTTECVGNSTSCYMQTNERGCRANCTSNNETECCDSDLCNNRSIALRRCYFCSLTSRVECDMHRETVTCGVGGVCRTIEYSLPQVLGGTTTSFQRGCVVETWCHVSNDCKSVSGGNCVRCCDSDLCNDGHFEANQTTATPDTNQTRSTMTSSARSRRYFGCGIKSGILLAVTLLVDY
ncbi:uncharacterized protein LOC134178927 [Corticium candelabrum]|uniref:uncharacterized protein LOC134178927 n=1 Tax=Corticium candelabrum TaxID=121492 RepID=UPI002E254467|nr:uncharacterized protein LOC134178927 [Corticium candelabrum]